MRRILVWLWRGVSAPFRFLAWLFRQAAKVVQETLAGLRSFFSEEPDDTPVTDAFSRAVENPQDLLFHLDALRKHLLRSLFVLILTTSLSFAFTERILEVLAQPLEGGIDSLQAIDVTEPLGVFMRVALLTGFALALPYISLELWLFAAPGLRRRARFFGLLAIPLITIFFLAGMAFTYFVMLDPALDILINWAGFNTAPRPSTYFPFVTGLMFWIGIIFEFPLVIYILASLGLVQASTLVRQSRIAVVILAIVAAAITPTIDPITMLLVWGPLVVLYFFGIGLAYLAQGRRRSPEGEVSEVGVRN
jgi:sec-independent protein translocase protein TatC